MFNNFRLKRVTYNLGDVVETDEDITCAVNNQKLLDRLSKNNNHLLLKSKNDPKIITYVISNMTFPSHFKLTTDDNVVFINCTFQDEVYIATANKVSFTNNKYLIASNNFIYNDRFFVIDNTNKVDFINDRFINGLDLARKYEMKINANQIGIHNSVLYNNNEGHVFFNCNRLDIRDSKLSLRTGKIKSSKVLIDAYSEVDVSKKIIIDCKNHIGLANINCGDIIMNSTRYTNIKEPEKPNKIKIKINS